MRRKRGEAHDDAIEWKDYPRIPSGEYAAYCAWAGKYQDPGYKRWTCLLLFDVFRESFTEIIARIPMWLSLGSGKRATASRRGKFLPEWVRANGAPPVRADRLSARVFAHRMCTVEVGDTLHGPVPYSVVKKIISWDTGGNSVNKVSQSRSKAGSEHGVKQLPQGAGDLDDPF
jgi:hypothetical protein